MMPPASVEELAVALAAGGEIDDVGGNEASSAAAVDA
jgi:hypothetical protein